MAKNQNTSVVKETEVSVREKIGAIRYFNSIEEIPPTAKYTLEFYSDGIRLQEYDGLKDSKILAVFEEETFDYKESFYEVLETCRKMINCKSVIWVEYPNWKTPILFDIF